MDKSVLEELLNAMTRSGASSLHLIPGHVPCIRAQRRFVQSDHRAIAAKEIEELVRDILFEDHRRSLRDQGQVEVLYTSRAGARFRTTVLRQSGGPTVLMRPVPEQPPRLQSLDLPSQVGSFAQLRRGVVVVAGFFGAGKSTTLAAVVDKINHESLRNIVTVEGPIEFLHPTQMALLHQREVGPHVATFAAGVRQAVRSGAEVIAVDDLRDVETLEAVLDAVESGCLALVAMNASSVVAACSAIADMIRPEQRERVMNRFAASLRAITAQTLLQRIHQKGRVPMVEILINNAAVRAAVEAGTFDVLPGIMGRCGGLGMQTSDMALRSLLARQLITPEEAIYHASEREKIATAAASGSNGSAH